MVVCTILLSVVATVLVPGIHAIHEQRKATRYETLALIELNNLATQFAVSQDTANVQLTSAFAARYSNASFTINRQNAADATVVPYRITISRHDSGGHPQLDRSLTVWKSTKEATP